MPRKGPMTLGLFLNHTGHHVASWRHPGAQADANINIAHYLEIAKAAEAAKFDFMFFADSVAMRQADMQALSRSAQYTAYFEPITLLSAMSVVTKHIGLISTATTSYYEPFQIARLFASLDHLSGGRAGWNIVTSSMKAEAQNFGRDEHFGHAERYKRAWEFMEVVKGLWDSWDDDAFMRDKTSGQYFNSDKVHYLNHIGDHFKVRGPLNVPRPIQGYPVLVQAGSSEDGRDFAASTAEIAFTSELTFESARAYADDVRARMEKAGRNPRNLRILPGVAITVGRTDEEANEKFEYLQSLVDPIVGREILSTVLGFFDLSGYDLDGPLPEIPESDATKSGTTKNVIAMARRENLTIRQLYLRISSSRGKMVMNGSPKTVADQLEAWYEGGAVDGFNIQPPYLPGGLDEIVELLVPELKKRGLMRTEYAGTTLRENLGLPRPASRYAAE